MKKISIIGAGISGLSIANMLLDKFEVEVLEKGEKPGGLIKCDRIDGVLFHRVGGHVFNSKNNAVLEWFWDHFDRETEFVNASRNARILLGDRIIGYPIENYLYQLPEEQARAIIEELIAMMASGQEGKITTNFKDFLEDRFGKKLYELYFGPYNSKIWNTDLSKVPLNWLEGKLPMPSKKEILISNMLRKEESGMVHASFYYPAKDGSQFIINRLAEGQDVKVGYRVNRIKIAEGSLLKINDEFSTDSIVYCGDVRELADIVDTVDIELKEALKAATGFTSNGTSNALCEADASDISWLYLPENKFRAHRIIYTGNFSPTNNSSKPGRISCVVEFNGKQTQEDMLKDLALLPGNLEAIAFNYEPNSYIIHDEYTREKIALLKTMLERYHIHLLGRFAEWEYYNMDKCIESAMELCKKL